MEKTVIEKLGIKSEDTICMIRPNKKICAFIKQIGESVHIFIDEIVDGCNVILYWVDPTDDIRKKMLEFQDKIKVDGRVWLIIPKKHIREKMRINIDWNSMQEEVLKTRFVDNKVVSINENEYGTQFVIRKKYR